MENMEHFARIQLVAELLGGAKVLPRTEVDKLLDARTRYGVKPRDAGSRIARWRPKSGPGLVCGATWARRRQ